MPSPTQTPTDLPDYYQAAAFARHEAGDARGGVTPSHILYAGSLLGSKGYEGEELVALLAKAVEALIADACVVH